MPHGAASRRTAALLFAALTTAAADTCETTPIPTVIVADVGVDDALALLWAVASPSLDVLGVAASFGGHADPRMTARNALRVLAAANRSDIPVFVGSLYPFGQATMMRGNTFHGVDGFGDVPMMDSEPPATEPSSGTSAAEFIAASARRHAGKLVVLCFSPLVDVALASLLEPTLPSLLSQLVVMGGAIHTHGNAAPLAEANFHHDAAAARLVLTLFAAASDASKLVLAPLDMTMQPSALTSADALREVGELGGACALFAAACARYQASYCTYGGMCDRVAMHDSHTVAWLLEPLMYSRVQQLALQVHVGAPEDAANGMSWLDQRESAQSSSEARPTVSVLLEVDGERFHAAMLRDLRRVCQTQRNE